MKRLFFLLLACVSLTACSTKDADTTDADTTAVTEVPAEVSEATDSESVTETADSEAMAGETQYPYSYVAYSDEKEEFPQVINETPSRVICNTQGMLEIMLDLGLGDTVVGRAKAEGPVAPRLNEEFEAIEEISSTTTLSKEIVFGADPDLVLGRAIIFQDAEWGCGTIDALNEAGIAVFTQTASLTGASVDALYDDIMQIGAIFNIQDRAAEYVEQMKGQLETIDEKMKGYTGEDRSYILIYGPVDGNQFTTLGEKDAAIAGEDLAHLKMKNALELSSEALSAEQLIASNPDIIIYLNYDGSGLTDEEALAGLQNNASLQSISALNTGNIYTAEFMEVMPVNVQMFESIAKLGEQIYPELFTK